CWRAIELSFDRCANLHHTEVGNPEVVGNSLHPSSLSSLSRLLGHARLYVLGCVGRDIQPRESRIRELGRVGIELGGLERGQKSQTGSEHVTQLGRRAHGAIANDRSLLRPASLGRSLEHLCHRYAITCVPRDDAPAQRITTLIAEQDYPNFALDH